MHHNNVKLPLTGIMLLALMLLSAALAAALRPTISLADERPPIDLKTMVPSAFGDWREEIDVVAQVVNPQQKGVIDKIYSQTLSRTYANKQGYRIMLSIAYGKSQSDALQLHKPEVCYPAQGFQLLSKQTKTLDLLGRPISVVHIETSLGRRYEPVTYWTVVGDYITTGQISKKIAEMRHALLNQVPDGMLIRVSSIDMNTAAATQLQNQFSIQMLASISTDHRHRFGGLRVAQ